MALRYDPEDAANAGEALSALRRFARPQAKLERCELCSAPLNQSHQHLLDRKTRQIACACDGCTILFCGQEGGKFLRIPRRIRRLEDFSLSDLEWEAMMLPINLAFFLRDANGRISALYPSPAGAIDSQIDLSTLDHGSLGDVLRAIEPEVEAVLINRICEVHATFVIPLDECYRLVGIVKTKWRGLSGGSEVWTAIQGFF